MSIPRYTPPLVLTRTLIFLGYFPSFVGLELVSMELDDPLGNGVNDFE